MVVLVVVAVALMVDKMVVTHLLVHLQPSVAVAAAAEVLTRAENLVAVAAVQVDRRVVIDLVLLAQLDRVLAVVEHNLMIVVAQAAAAVLAVLVNRAESTITVATVAQV
jgi:hypothetical protein